MPEILPRKLSVSTRLYFWEDEKYVLGEEFEDVIIPPGDLRLSELIIMMRELKLIFVCVRSEVVLDRIAGKLYNDLYLIPHNRFV